MKNVIKELAKLSTVIKVPKSERNNFGNYNYRSLELINEKIKVTLKEHNIELLIILSDDIVNIPSSYTIFDYNPEADNNSERESSDSKTYVKATATAYYTGTGEPESISVSAFARETITRKGMDAAQITGAASSYARKYALGGLLGLDDSNDPDANDNSNINNKAKSVPKPKQPNKQASEQLPGCISTAQANRLFAIMKSAGFNSYMDMKNAVEFKLNMTFKPGKWMLQIPIEKYDEICNFYEKGE